MESFFRNQFIGIQDKNGRSLREGDKVKGLIRGKEFTGTIVYHVRSCSFYIETGKFKYIRFSALKTNGEHSTRDFKELEIVNK
jgi:hypothetical protein